MHVLVVADEAWVLDEVRSSLGESRYRLTEVDDPRRVVEACRDQEPDVAVVDLQIGSMGGMAVARLIREAAGAGEITAVPTVLLLDRDADAFLARRSGASGWLRKPFTSFALRSVLDGLAPPQAEAETAE